MGKLIRDGNQVYEIDEECIRKREETERDRQTENSSQMEEYSRQTGRNRKYDREKNRFRSGR